MTLRAAQIGGASAEEIAASTMGMYETLRGVISDLAARDAELRTAFEEADAFRNAAQPFMIHPFVAQATRADSPIGETWFVPSLLSEPPETIRRVMALFETTPDPQGEAERARQQGARLIAELQARGDLSEREIGEKLDALGIKPRGLQP